MDKKDPFLPLPPKQPLQANEVSIELNFPKLLQVYHYFFRTLEEANELAAYLCTFYPQNSQKSIELGLNEIFINAIEHGSLQITFEEKSRLKRQHSWLKEVNRRLDESKNINTIVDVRLEVTPSYICATVKDRGCGFPWWKYCLQTMNPSHDLHGRGLLIAQTLCFDKLEFSNKGNEVQCYFYFSSQLFNFPSLACLK